MSISDTDAPISHFTHCHVGILAQLSRLNELPALLGPAALARKTRSRNTAQWASISAKAASLQIAPISPR